jgi:mannose-6-phosphate isomerase-like protein (cupin superfamily)
MTSTPLPLTPLSLCSPETGESFYFRSSARGPDGRFAFQWRLAPGKAGPGPHDHPFENDTFAVVSGRLQIFMQGTCHELGPGDVLVVPAGVTHHFGHPGGEECVVEVSMDGARMEDQFVPLAQHFGSPSSLPLKAVPLTVVHIEQAMRQGASHPASGVLRALFGAMAAFFRLFGLRPLPPVRGWDRAVAV